VGGTILLDTDGNLLILISAPLTFGRASRLRHWISTQMGAVIYRQNMNTCSFVALWKTSTGSQNPTA